ncbi:MAG: AMP-binding protein, partial [Alphaproteobacteria bacterium]|nr:AMP-binding protein [Alphaproteobacteria bacterium]
MATPIATDDPALPRRMADFDTLAEALDYAAKGSRGFNFFSLRGELEASITFSELRDRAMAHARRFIAAGLERGDRVAIVADTSPHFVSTFFGCQYAGLLPVPLPLPTSFGGRDGYVEQLHKQMLSCNATAAVAPDMMRDLLLQAGKGLDLKLICSDKELEGLTLAKTDPQPSGKSDICYLQYSSGSTRFPHGVTVTQGAAMANCRSNALHGVSIQDGDRGMSWLPFYHDMGLVGFMLTLLCTQVTTDYLPTEYFARRPLMWMELMSRHGGTLAFSPSFGYELCQRRTTEDRVASLDLSQWRVAGIGADMIRADVMKAFADTFAPAGFKPGTFMPSYGLAEATLAVSFMPPGRGIETDIVDEDRLSGENRAVPVDPENFERSDSIRHVVNCGRPLPDCAVEIRNENGDDLPDREVGKVFVKGPSIMT